MKGCSALVVAIVVLAAMPFPGVAQDQVPQEQFQFTAFQLKHADVAKFVKKLRALLGEGGDVTVCSEKDTNTVFLRARPEKIQQAREILHRIDVGMPKYLTIIPLKHVDAARTSGTLQAILKLIALFGDDDRDIRVIADVRGNSIVIWASEETRQQAKAILHWLDVRDK